MYHLKKTGIFILALLFVFACKKTDEQKDLNVLKINSGTNSGFVYVYSPNMGFWSPVNETVKYIHLVFGSTDNQVTTGKDIMSILFYDEGNGSVSFPSAQGQHCNFSVTINGVEKYYSVEDATLAVSEITEDHFKGSLMGTFISGGPEFESVVVSMEIDIPMKGI